MANDKIRNNYKDIANAIRSKTGDVSSMSAEDMPNKITQELAKKPEGTFNITENDTYNIASYENVEVNVAGMSLDDGLYNVSDGDATNLIQKICASNSSGEMIAIGDYPTDQSDLDFVFYESNGVLNSVFVPQGGNTKAYVWGRELDGYKSDHVENGHHYKTSSSQNEMLEDLGYLNKIAKNITYNGTHDVTNYLSVDVNVPQPHGTLDTYTINTLEIVNVKDYEYVRDATFGMPIDNNMFDSRNDSLRYFYDTTMPGSCHALLTEGVEIIGNYDIAIKLPNKDLGMCLPLCIVNCNDSSDEQDWELIDRYVFQIESNYGVYEYYCLFSYVSISACRLRDDESYRQSPCLEITVLNAIQGISEYEIIEYVKNRLGVDTSLDIPIYGISVDGKLIYNRDNNNRTIITYFVDGNYIVEGLPGGGSSNNNGEYSY